MLKLAVLLLAVAFVLARVLPRRRLPWAVPVAVVGTLLVVRTVGWLAGDSSSAASTPSVRPAPAAATATPRGSRSGDSTGTCNQPRSTCLGISMDLGVPAPAFRGTFWPVYDVDPVGLLAREVLRERLAVLVAEACAWSVGLSDAPHAHRRHGRVVPSGTSIGARAAAGQQLGGEEDTRLELGDARPGSFADVLNALAPDGRLYADRFEAEVLAPFVTDTCVIAAQRARGRDPQAWEELLDELGEQGDDLPAVVRAAEWEAPLRTEAEQLLLAALGAVPLVEVEAEGLPLSLVRAAEAELRPPPGEPAPAVLGEQDLAGALFLAGAALERAALPVPVPPEHAEALLETLRREGIEQDEVLALLPLLPVQADTADAVAAALRRTP